MAVQVFRVKRQKGLGIFESAGQGITEGTRSISDPEAFTKQFPNVPIVEIPEEQAQIGNGGHRFFRSGRSKANIATSQFQELFDREAQNIAALRPIAGVPGPAAPVPLRGEEEIAAAKGFQTAATSTGGFVVTNPDGSISQHTDLNAAIAASARSGGQITSTPKGAIQQPAQAIDLSKLPSSTDSNVLAARTRIRTDQRRGLITPEEIIKIAGISQAPPSITTEALKGAATPEDLIIPEAPKNIPIPNVARLGELAKQGLTEADILRTPDGQIFIKADSKFAAKMTPLEALEPEAVDTTNAVQISGPSELQRLAEQGLKETDLIRKGGDIFIRPDSSFATNMPPKEITQAAPEEEVVSEEVKQLEVASNSLSEVQTELQDAIQDFDDREAKLRAEDIPQTQIDKNLRELSREKQDVLSDLEIRNKIAESNFDRLESIRDKDLLFNREMLLNGFREVSAEDALEFNRDRIFNDPVTGKTFVGPSNLQTQVVTADGKLKLINSQTGDTISIIGNASGLDPLDMMKLWEAGYDLDENGNLAERSTMPSVGSSVDTNIGSGIITGYGSPLWEYGLDMVVDGGKGTMIQSPFDFKVLEILNEEDSGGFGNQIKIQTRDGQEVWFSHLDEVNNLSSSNPSRKDGFFSAGTALGTQGNTGQVLSANSGDGTHLDVTMPKVVSPSRDKPSDWLAPQEVAERLGILPNKNGGGELSVFEKLSSRALSIEIFGKRAGSKPENYELIEKLMADGRTIDDIRDDLRFNSQSTTFQGVVRTAAENVGFGLSSEQKEGFFDALDRSLGDNNMIAARETLKKAAIQSLTTATGDKVRGDDRAVQLLKEIAQDLKAYEDSGGRTNIFKGTSESALNKIAGITSNPALAELATKIQMGIQNYRKAISGAAFTESESKEYKAIFPSINKTKELNTAKLNAAVDVMSGNVDFFLGEQMGKSNYEEIFKDNSDDLLENASSEQIKLLKEKGLI